MGRGRRRRIASSLQLRERHPSRRFLQVALLDNPPASAPGPVDVSALCGSWRGRDCSASDVNCCRRAKLKLECANFCNPLLEVDVLYLIRAIQCTSDIEYDFNDR